MKLRHDLGLHGMDENNLPPRLNSGQLTSGNESSFSYLPSIQGVFRTKLNSGASADIMASGRRQRFNGAYPKTGKNPLLMNGSRAARRLGNGLVLDTEKANGIKLFDAAKAREMLAKHSDSSNRIMDSPPDKGAKSRS